MVLYYLKHSIPNRLVPDDLLSVARETVLRSRTQSRTLTEGASRCGVTPACTREKSSVLNQRTRFTSLRRSGGQSHHSGRIAGAGSESPGKASEIKNGGLPASQGSRRSFRRASWPRDRAHEHAMAPSRESACQGVVRTPVGLSLSLTRGPMAFRPA